RCSARSRASRAHSLIRTICSIVFPWNQSGISKSIWIAVGRVTTTKGREVCAIGLSGKDIARARSCFTSRSRKQSTTRRRGLRVVRSHSSSFSETCHGSQNRGDPNARALRFALLFYPDQSPFCLHALLNVRRAPRFSEREGRAVTNESNT